MDTTPTPDLPGLIGDLEAAKAALRHACERMRDLEGQGLVVWGRTQRGHDGWLVKGKVADAAFSEWARCDSDVLHWMRLLAHTETPVVPPGKVLAFTAEELERRKVELAAQVAARLGEKPDDDERVPF